MSTTRPFAYNLGLPITGTTQLGDLAIGVDPLDYPGGVGGVRWWEGPDEDLGYVICRPNLSGNQPNPVGSSAYVQFWRTTSFTDNSFLICSLVNLRPTSTLVLLVKLYLNCWFVATLVMGVVTLEAELGRML